MSEEAVMELYRQVVIRTRLSKVFADDVVRRASKRVGIAEPGALTVDDLPRLLPELKKAVDIFLDPADGARAMADLHSLLDSAAKR